MSGIVFSKIMIQLFFFIFGTEIVVLLHTQMYRIIDYNCQLFSIQIILGKIN